jgi:hypothetical protein
MDECAIDCHSSGPRVSLVEGELSPRASSISVCALPCSSRIAASSGTAVSKLWECTRCRLWTYGSDAFARPSAFCTTPRKPVKRRSQWRFIFPLIFRLKAPARRLSGRVGGWFSAWSSTFGSLPNANRSSSRAPSAPLSTRSVDRLVAHLYGFVDAMNRPFKHEFAREFRLRREWS